MSRKKARIGSMKILYQMDLNKDYSLDTIDLFINSFDFEGDTEFLYNTVNGILNNFNEINNLIESNLQGWSINRLAKIDLAVLRIAVYEFLFEPKIPYEVSINEAIEISKKFSSEDSYKFINGILGSIYKGLDKDGK